MRGTPPFGDCTQNIDRARHREDLALIAIHVERILASPVCGMKNEPAARLDRSAVMNRAVGSLARLDFELTEQAAKRDSSALVTNADANRTIFVVHAKRDDRALETWIGHSRHGEKKLAGEETGLISHKHDNGTTRRAEQYLRRS